MRKFLICIAILFFAVCPAEAQLTQQQAQSVWLQVARPTELTGLPFGIKKSITPNAWVTAGKSVTVTTGLLEMLETESELYGVLAHEAGHVKLRHTNKTVSKQVGKFILVTAMNSLFGSAAGSAASIGTDLVAAGYSREQEIAADDYAIRLAYENGQDLTGLYYALKKISQRHKTEPSGFNSHPPDERRLLHIKNTIIALNQDKAREELKRSEAAKTQEPMQPEMQQQKQQSPEEQDNSIQPKM